MGAPWWSSQFKRIDNLGAYPDPEGPYYKPDTNILIPPGYEVQAISPGTVTNVRDTSWGTWVVTVKLDSPINGEATHQFYEHMSAATVSAGQHINQGDLLGYNNLSGASLGFGFYGGDIYGNDPGWSQLQADLAAHGNAAALSPVAFLDAMAGVVPDFSQETASLTSTGGGALSLLQQLPGGLSSVPLIIGLLLVAAIGLGVFLLWKELE